MNRNIYSVRLLCNSHNINVYAYVYIYIAAAVTLDLASLRFKQHRVERHEVAGCLIVCGSGKLSICMRSVRAFALYSTFGSHNSPYFILYCVPIDVIFYFRIRKCLSLVTMSMYVVCVLVPPPCVYTHLRLLHNTHTFISTINCRTAILWSLSPLTDTHSVECAHSKKKKLKLYYKHGKHTL